MMLWFMLVSAAFASIEAFPSDKKIVCYFGSWAVYRPPIGRFEIDNIDAKLCTHLIYTFVGLSEDGNINVLDPWQDLADNYGKDGFGRFNALRTQNPSLKTLIAIGGWNEGSIKYSSVFGDAGLRAKFVNNAIEFIKKYEFNGLDMDWEYPNQRGGKLEDIESFTMLIKELKEKFDPEGLLLSAAVASVESSASLSYNIREISKYIDFINLMAYDLRGPWDAEKKVGINAPLYPSSKEDGLKKTWNVDSVVKYWLSEGAEPEKIILGTAFYGRTFTLADPIKHHIGDLFSGPGQAGKYSREAGMIGYNEICEMQKTGNWKIVFDKEQLAPYTYNGNQWIGYDDVRSLTEKAKYAYKMGLGGIMLWSIETDDFLGVCGEKYPLLKTLNSVFGGGLPVPLPTYPPSADESSSPELPTSDEPSNTTQGTDTPPSPPVHPAICERPGYVRDSHDCTIFYYCKPVGDNYQISQFQCPPGTAFDTKILVCNHIHLVQC